MKIDFEKFESGLAPAIIQDYRNRESIDAWLHE